MPIQYTILGNIFLDNALWVRVESGQAIHRLLFDCGEAVLYNLGNAEIQNTEHLFFSHCHMDHIGGFDSFCRLNYSRSPQPVCVWGPQDIMRVMSHRLRGFTWNLIYGQQGIWKIYEVLPQQIRYAEYHTADAFSTEYDLQIKDWMDNKLLDESDFLVKAVLLNHGISSIGYIISEPIRWNVSKEMLSKLGLVPGPWLNVLKNFKNPDSDSLIIGQQNYLLGDLRSQLLSQNSGSSLAYLTDFVWDQETEKKLVEIIPPHSIVICESQYLHKDVELAQKNFHLTSVQSAQLAKLVSASKLILIHISQRYTNSELPLLLNQAREIFPETYFPDKWNIK